MPRYGTPDIDFAMRLAACDPADDGPVYMVNLMKYREVADYRDGGSDEAPVSGREADDRYAPLDVLAAIGAHVCFHGDVMASTEDWDRVGVVCYPTRRAFMEMQQRKDFQDKHVHKEAGMDHTIVMVTVPVGGLPGSYDGPVLLEVWDGEPPAPGGEGASEFTVEGTILGDGRHWSGVRWSAAPPGAELGEASPGSQRLVVSPGRQRWHEGPVSGSAGQGPQTS